MTPVRSWVTRMRRAFRPKAKAGRGLWPATARIDGVENLRLAADRRARHNSANGRRRHVQ